MASNCYSIRVLFSGSSGHVEKITEGLEWETAKRKFVFYVSACMEFPELQVRCINLIRNKKTIKLFQNYGYSIARR